MKHIIIDTSEYYGNRFEFSSSAFESLTRLVEIGFVKLYTQEIIDYEVKNKIEESQNRILAQVNESINILSKKREIFPFKNDVLKLKESMVSLLSGYKNDYDIFLGKCDAFRIPTANDITHEIMEKYFNRQFPFSDKKKSEFPDAMAILSIKNFFENNELPEGDQLIIVSRDKDWEDNYFPQINFKIYQDIQECLNSLNTELEEKISENINYYFENHSNQIEKRIQEEILDIIDFFDTTQEGDIEHIENVSVSDIDDVEIISIIRDEKIVVSCTFNLSARLSICINDYENSPWDSEDKKYMWLETLEGVIDHEEEYLSCEIIFEYDDLVTYDNENPDIDFRVTKVNDSGTIYVDFEN